MIEMNEDFQKEFGCAMAQLRAVVSGLSQSASNARGEARSVAASEEAEAAIPAYEASHAYWTAFERTVPVLGSFEDADRLLASLVDGASKGEELSLAERVYQQRIQYLEKQLGRLDTALRGRPATLDEKIRETETAEDLIGAAVRLIQDAVHAGEAERVERRRADDLAKVTTAAAKLLGVTTLPEILTALERLVTGGPFDLANLPSGSLIAGQWSGSSIAERRVYVGRYEGLRASGDVTIARVCNHCDGLQDDPHVLNTDLARDTVRLPTADEILEFDRLARQTGLLRLPTDGDE